MSYMRYSVWRVLRSIGRINQYVGKRHNSKVQSDSGEIPLKPQYIPLRGYLLLSVPFATFCTGVYFEFKEDILKEQAQQFGFNSLEPPIAVEVADEEFRKVSITGKFDHSREIYIMHRPRKTGCETLSYFADYTNGYDSILHKKRIGHWVITPFVLSSGKVILVNRGWVPPELKDPNSRKGQLEGEVTLTGYLRKQSETPFFIFSRFWYHRPEKGEWGYMDIPGMSQALNTEPIVVDLDRSAYLGLNAPIPNQTLLKIHIRESDKYLILLLSVALSALWYYKFVGPIKLQPHWW